MIEARGQVWNDMSPCSLVVRCHKPNNWRWKPLTGCERQDDVCPSFEHLIGNVELPLDSLQEDALVSVDLRDLETRHFTPSLG